MKAMKCMLTAFLVLAVFVGCNRDPDSPPKIVVKTAKGEASYAVRLLQWNGKEYQDETDFQTITNQETKPTIPYIPLKDEVVIEFQGEMPKEATLNNRILTREYLPRYGEKITQENAITIQNQQITFQQIGNVASGLSSNLADYQPGAVLQGYVLRCKWGKNECEYLFIIRTDSGIFT